MSFIKSEFKKSIRRKEIDLILSAESKTAENGDSRGVVRLSKLLNKRLDKIEDFILMEEIEECENPINSN